MGLVIALLLVLTVDYPRFSTTVLGGSRSRSAHYSAASGTLRSSGPNGLSASCNFWK
jgi:hypothetical protein